MDNNKSFVVMAWTCLNTINRHGMDAKKTPMRKLERDSKNEPSPVAEVGEITTGTNNNVTGTNNINDQYVLSKIAPKRTKKRPKAMRTPAMMNFWVWERFMLLWLL